ncbi:MAG: hypothetical protein COV55_03570 [Candidatus Komeilibacteria bacterium CG11_big_fil_rev_8_21_14_0_20_36_20]|uniref:HD domain-containing protein n=1 Tax=Candidatus Komeilibacteria bacterium CG11_big_fil_rev_8_21_14_0_20_36_20 TaxID=1974477 RepID=A0A2H0NCH0_9BACT|nr:MAG: hypothetical protein COV55_03570 [Candidatus Komeilibacteria bacterium CG11_big_fil_rev_8_21_14_0_20_36_20]PIR81910.1 MAG: hypothetical protein COU21_01015 [Candidatus Komeilibacteria bacterium CG10_big_fil_rev_8_21_14_0_10_36_65]PJC55363.1 MAG: hypothetical protein CO027_02430 [Candidatus Komeilibacteria bacterium CG_4_9_14_0_2_um_filter_36_13]
MNYGIKIPERTIHIPINGPVDITGLRPIIDSPNFQGLLEHYQLGFAYKVLPGGVHTRFEHSLGVLCRLRQIIERLKIVDRDVVHALEVAALLHDIGHGPFSHEIEKMLPFNHTENGLRILQSLQNVIASYANYQLVEKLFNNQHPLGQLIHSPNFGADKMDYLHRDAHHTGYELAFNADKIMQYLQFIENQLGISDKVIEEAINYQFSYLRMYKMIYLNGTAKIITRMFQRALAELSRLNLDLYNLSDSEALTLAAKHSLGKNILLRKLHKAIATFKIAPYADEQHLGDFDYPIHEIDSKLLQKWNRFLSSPKKLLELEKQLEKELKLKSGEILIVQPGFFERLALNDVVLFKKDNSTDSLFSRVPSHINTLREMVDRFFYIHVATTQENIIRLVKIDFKKIFEENISE